MPPRLNKRQQRELEELEALNVGKSSRVADVSSGSDDEPGPSQRRGAFSTFLPTNNNELPSDDDEEEEVKTGKKKKSKKKKKPITAEIANPDVAKVKESTKTSRTSTPPPVRNEKKALKKAKAKEKKAANDELDQALAELSLQYPASQKISQTDSGKHSLADLLSVSLQHLDGDAEMRKFFGSRVVQANKTSESSNRKRVPTVRSHLTRPQPTWWAAKGREGLSLRPLSDEEVDEKLKRHMWAPIQEKWWTVEYSKKYKSMTKAFMETVQSGDPQGFWDLLGTLPWHADTILQVSEVYRHREEHAQAIDFIDRALFTYERSFIGSFTFTSGLNRLDFDHVENRPFFLALHRQITDLQRRGCVRTAFEFARLMYSLDPWEDPHGALFHLDFLAIKSGMQQWLLDLFDVFNDRRRDAENKEDARLDPTILPGWAYARALALRISEVGAKNPDHSNSSSALQEAVRDFPSIVPLLADKLDASLPAGMRAHRDFKIEIDNMSLSVPMGALHLLTHLYVQRSAPIWKEHSSWFSSTITEAFSALPTSLPVTERRQRFLSQYGTVKACYPVYRHIMVLETSFRRLFSFIPRQVMEAKSLACDPLPPPTTVNQYDQAFFRGVDDLYSPRVRSRRQRANDDRRLAQLIPDAAFRQQLQAFFEAHPHFAERFPQGILQFAQMAGQLPPDVLEDLMLVEAVNAPGPAGGMPGGLDNMQDEEERMVEINFVERGDALPALVHRGQEVEEDIEEGEEDEDDDEDEDEIISPMPRVLRNILGRFWGRAAPEESSSEDEALLDNDGVD
ncbi:transcriptional repressor TCF25-domain-containing protein [Crassisporium funariophilum]|nr:transcriptional repressor TCF25-domain-containing protein [Crassisporium funariophilum]